MSGQHLTMQAEHLTWTGLHPWMWVGELLHHPHCQPSPLSSHTAAPWSELQETGASLHYGTLALESHRGFLIPYATKTLPWKPKPYLGSPIPGLGFLFPCRGPPFLLSIIHILWLPFMDCVSDMPSLPHEGFRWREHCRLNMLSQTTGSVHPPTPRGPWPLRTFSVGPEHDCPPWFLGTWAWCLKYLVSSAYLCPPSLLIHVLRWIHHQLPKVMY